MIKPKCPECDQIIQKSIFDRCMYCGKNLPVELCCSDEEKKKLIEIKNTYEKNRVKYENKIRNNELDTDYFWGDLFL